MAFNKTKYQLTFWSIDRLTLVDGHKENFFQFTLCHQELFGVLQDFNQPYEHKFGSIYRGLKMLYPW